MKRRFTDFWLRRREHIGNRLRYGPQKRYFRCPACRAVQSVPICHAQTKVVCRKCGEIFLRRT
ncbi:MAG: hypothetical protein E7434_03260 [Ruminococcaceae bacterium]|nr:hypothetical protein [Oscillospiraceae bacterium]